MGLFINSVKPTLVIYTISMYGEGLFWKLSQERLRYFGNQMICSAIFQNCIDSQSAVFCACRCHRFGVPTHMQSTQAPTSPEPATTDYKSNFLKLLSTKFPLVFLLSGLVVTALYCSLSRDQTESIFFPLTSSCDRGFKQFGLTAVVFIANQSVTV